MAIRSFGLADIRENGGHIGRPYTDMYDPDFPSLIFGLTGRPGTAYNSAWQTKWSNNFSVNFDPWEADSANLNVANGILTISNAAYSNAGAILWAEGLTPGSRVRFSGRFRSTVIGGAIAYIWDATGALPWTGIYSQSNLSANTFANFSGIVTVPASGLLQFGLLSNGAVGVVSDFDDVVIETEVLTPVSTLPPSGVKGNALTWFGNAGISTSTWKYYGSSLSFPAVGDRVSAAFPSAINDSDFILQGYSYFTSTAANRGVISLSYGDLRIHTGGTGAWTVIDGGVSTVMSTLAQANTHYFWRLSRVGGRFSFMVDGTVLQTWNGTGTVYDIPFIVLGASTTTASSSPLNLTDESGTAFYLEDGTALLAEGNFSSAEPTYDLTHGGFMTDVLLYGGTGNLDPYTPPSLGYENRMRRYVRGVWRI